MKKSYLPGPDGLFSTWLTTFANNIGAYASKYAISTAEVTAIQKAALFYAYWYAQSVNIELFKQGLIKFKNELRYGIAANATASLAPADITFSAPPSVDPGLEDGIRSIVARIKKNQAYTIADGEVLGIVGADHVVDINTLKPEFKIVLQAGHPNLVWVKGISGGVKIYVDRGTGFTLLAVDTVPDYLDTFALPAPGLSALWKYKMIYVINDEEVGMMSDVKEITVAAL